MKHYIHYIKGNLLSVLKTIRPRLLKISSLKSFSSQLLNFGICFNEISSKFLFKTNIMFIKHNYWFFLGIWCLFTLSFNLQSFLEPNPWDKPYDDRSCYQIMNEPDPYKDYDEYAAKLHYYKEKGLCPLHDPMFDPTYDPIIQTPSDIKFLEDKFKYSANPFLVNESGFNNDSDTSSASSDSEYSDTESNTSGDISESESEEIDKNLPPIKSVDNFLMDSNRILDEYYKCVSQGKSDQEIIRLSLEYIDSVVPEDIWARSEQDIRNTSHKAYMLLDKFNSELNLDTEESRVAYLQINATFNARNILNLNTENMENEEIVIKVFDSCMQAIINSIES